MSRCLCCEKRDAGHRYSCDHCVNDMRRWLRELEDYAAILLGMRGSIGSKPHGSIGVSFGSKPPMSLTPVALLDPRSAMPEREEEEPLFALHPETVAAILIRDGGCTWVAGHPHGGAYDYLNGDYDPARRCAGPAAHVDYIANPEERDHANLRSLCTPHYAHLQRQRAIHEGPDPVGMEEHDSIRSLPSSIHGIACWIREEREESEPSTWTLVSELRYLRGQVSGCAVEQWVDELHSDLKELHRQARTLAKDSPRPLGPCLSIDCDGMVFWDIHEENGKRVDQARCAACRRLYSGLDLIKLGISSEEAG